MPHSKVKAHTVLPWLGSVLGLLYEGRLGCRRKSVWTDYQRVTAEITYGICLQMDTLTAVERSQRMARISSKNTKPELVVRHLVFSLGYRYRLHSRDLPGSPDLVFRSRKKAIFVHGCFWHCHEGCKVANRPKSRTEYWDDKFARNKQRDARNQRALKNLGWRSLVIWECQLKGIKSLQKRLQTFLGPIKRA